MNGRLVVHLETVKMYQNGVCHATCQRMTYLILVSGY